jgi:hypothetical protein
MLPTRIQRLSTPGWVAKGDGSGSRGSSSGSIWNHRVFQGGLELEVSADFARRAATVQGHAIDLTAAKAVLMDDVDTPAGPRLDRTLLIDANLTDDRRRRSQRDRPRSWSATSMGTSYSAGCRATSGRPWKAMSRSKRDAQRADSTVARQARRNDEIERHRARPEPSRLGKAVLTHAMLQSRPCGATTKNTMTRRTRPSWPSSPSW